MLLLNLTFTFSTYTLLICQVVLNLSPELYFQQGFEDRWAKDEMAEEVLKRL